MTFLYILLFLGFSSGVLLRWEFFPSVSVVPQDILLVILFLITWARGHIVKKNIVNNRVTKPLMLFFGVGIISLFINPLNLKPFELISSGMYLGRFILYSFLYFITSSLISKKIITKKFVLNLLLLFGGVVAFLGFMQLFLYPDIRNLFYLGWDPHYGRLVSVFLDPNFTGIILSLHLLLIIKLYIDKNFIINKKLLFLLGSLSFLALILTYSRSSWISFIAGLSFVLYKIKKLIYIIPVIMLLLFLVFIVPKPKGEGGNLQRTASSFARLDNYKKSLSLIQRQPLLGYGFNTLGYLSAPKEIPDHAASGADNSFLFVILTTGVLGLFVYLLLGWNIFKAGPFILQGSLVAVLVHSFFQNSLFFPAVLIWIWLLASLKNI